MSDESWIAVDWGTSHLRAWRMAGLSVVASAKSERGMGTLDRNEFEPALLDLIAPWIGDAAVDVVACGMVGARQGWTEAPYSTVPCAPLTKAPVRVAANDPRLRVAIIAGLKQEAPPDVMRGEETQIAGFLALNDGFDGVLCLPGTHTKWVLISAGEVIGFRTFMTGEMFALLGRQSVLRHTVGREGWDDEAFATAMDDVLSNPELLGSRLFELRADNLLNDLPPNVARAKLSGLLLGTEMAAARPYWLGQPVALIGSEAVCAPYDAALRRLGNPPMRTEGDTMTRAGLHAALQLVKGTSEWAAT